MHKYRITHLGKLYCVCIHVPRNAQRKEWYDKGIFKKKKKSTEGQSGGGGEGWGRETPALEKKQRNVDRGTK